MSRVFCVNIGPASVKSHAGAGLWAVFVCVGMLRAATEQNMGMHLREFHCCANFFQFSSYL